MSTESKQQPTGRQRRITVPEIAARKGGEPVVCLTAYTAPIARLLDPYCDLLLVGDSMGMVVYGMENTLGVTLEMSIAHGKAVMAGASRALVCIDMPFGSYQESPEQAFRNCAHVMAETGAQAVKLEGGREMAETVAFLVDRGVPVLAHVGLMPQMVNRAGGYRAQGRREEDWEPILADAKAVADAGAFATVLEGVSEPLARKLTEATNNVIIGIGASAACDGQILVVDDMLGMFPSAPKFVKKYADLGAEIDKAVKAFADDVRERRFPQNAHTYAMKKSGK